MKSVSRALTVVIEMVSMFGFVVATIKGDHTVAVACFALASAADSSRRVDALEDAFGDERDKRA